MRHHRKKLVNARPWNRPWFAALGEALYGPDRSGKEFGVTPMRINRGCWCRQRSRAAALINFIADLSPFLTAGYTIPAERAVTESKSLAGLRLNHRTQAFLDDLPQGSGACRGQFLRLFEKGVGDIDGRLHRAIYQ